MTAGMTSTDRDLAARRASARRTAIVVAVVALVVYVGFLSMAWWK
jgi:hypothetical protein